MSQDRAPRVSIGMPVFNGGTQFVHAVRSLLAQDMADFELIISDNASTDSTAEAARELAASDARIRYCRQASNIGPIANFSFVLAQARADHFMWAAADDSWDCLFIGQNLAFLEGHPDYVSSVSRAAFEGFGEADTVAMGTFALAGSERRNLAEFLRQPGANTRFYGLHRTQALRSAWIDEPFWALDWAVTCNLLSIGKQHEIPAVLMQRSPHGASRNAYAAISRSNAPALDKLFPYWRFTRHVLRVARVRTSPGLLARLAWLNLDAAVMMVRKRLASGRAARE